MKALSSHLQNSRLNCLRASTEATKHPHTPSLQDTWANSENINDSLFLTLPIFLVVGFAQSTYRPVSLQSRQWHGFWTRRSIFQNVGPSSLASVKSSQLRFFVVLLSRRRLNNTIPYHYHITLPAVFCKENEATRQSASLFRGPFCCCGFRRAGELSIPSSCSRRCRNFRQWYLQMVKGIQVVTQFDHCPGV